MNGKDDLTVQKELLSRRSWLAKGFKTAAALGLGAFALNAIGDLNPSVTSAMEKMTTGALDFAAADTCVLTCAATLGPCYSNVNLVRRDITSGIVGLPMRLGFRIVNADTCQPIQGATIDIWHTNKDGNYSALSGQCSNDSTTLSQNFSRGIQSSNADGWVYFDSIFPGWYSGRVTHMHLTVRIGTTAVVTTQFFFADRIAETIYRNHPLYVGRPNRDTTNTSDNVIGGNISRALPFIMTTKLVQNKYLQAVKTIAVRTTATTCNA
jgi:protocatechuate 3,4-dioxygenase beta subunit